MQSKRVRNSAVGAIAQTGVAALFAGFALTLSGCSVAIPVASSGSSPMLQADTQDITGSIPKRPLTLCKTLDVEDARRAGAAMSTALDPQGSGASVNWDNPQSGARGAFTPVGAAYPLEGRICRAFVADVSAKAASERLEGVACREKMPEWTLTEVKPFRKG